MVFVEKGRTVQRGKVAKREEEKGSVLALEGCAGHVADTSLSFIHASSVFLFAILCGKKKEKQK